MTPPNYGKLLYRTAPVPPTIKTPTSKAKGKFRSNRPQFESIEAALGDQVIWTYTQPPTKGNMVPIPDLPEHLVHALQQQGIEQVYSHQAEAFHAIRDGRDLLISTATASGKSLSTYLPVFTGCMEEGHRCLALYGIKALASDQEAKLQELLQHIPTRKRPVFAKMTGDEDRDKKNQLLSLLPHIVASTPETIHFLLYSRHWSPHLQAFLRKLRYVVIDEMHTLDGSFGANMSWLVQRIKLAVDTCGGNSNELQFVFLTATCANGADAARSLCFRTKRPERLYEITASGAATAEKRFIFLRPTWKPTIEATSIVLHLLQIQQSFIVFCNSREMTKNILDEVTKLADQEQVPGANKIALFYGSVPAARRKDIIQQLRDKRLLGVISTEALEAGIDLPELQVCLMVGWPGSISSFSQRAGRVGRRDLGTIIYLPYANDSVHGYYARRGQNWLADGVVPERISFHSRYRITLAKHILCAARECGIPQNKLLNYFGHDAIDIVQQFLEDGVLQINRQGGFYTRHNAHAEVNFRGSNSTENVELVDTRTGEAIEKTPKDTAYREVYPGAMYRWQDGFGEMQQLVCREITSGLQAMLEPSSYEPGIHTTPNTEMCVEVKHQLAEPKYIDIELPKLDVQNLKLAGDGSCPLANEAASRITLNLAWGEISQQVQGYDLVRKVTHPICNTKQCKKHKQKMAHGLCSECQQPTSDHESTEVVDTVTYEEPLVTKFETPMIQISFSPQLIAELDLIGQALWNAAQEKAYIPKLLEVLITHNGSKIALHTMAHQLVKAMPITDRVSDKDIEFALELSPLPNHCVGYFYERGESGAAFALFNNIEPNSVSAAVLARDCSCDVGCPCCTQMTSCPDKNEPLLKPMGLLMLDAIAKTRDMGDAEIQVDPMILEIREVAKLAPSTDSIKEQPLNESTDDDDYY